MNQRSSIVRKTLVTGALVTGVSIGAAGIATAATSSSTSGSSGSSNQSRPPAGAPGDPATMSHGPSETLLTGTDLQKAVAAANAAVPNSTVVRAESDSSGVAPFEVHMKKADGSYVTVELSSSFQVVKTVSGFGPGPAGSPAPSGVAPPSNPG